MEELKQKIVQLEEEVEEGERKLYGSKVSPLSGYAYVDGHAGSIVRIRLRVWL